MQPTIEPARTMRILKGLREQDAHTESQLAFKELYSLYYLRLWKYAERIINNRDIAEEIVSDCFFKIWERRDKFYGLHQIEKFLFRTTKNACIDYIRKSQTEMGVFRSLVYLAVHEIIVESDLRQKEVYFEIIQQLKFLPKQCREICTLTLLENLTTDEISRRLKKSIQNVSIQKARGAKMIRGMLNEKGLLP